MRNGRASVLPLALGLVVLAPASASAPLDDPPRLRAAALPSPAVDALVGMRAETDGLLASRPSPAPAGGVGEATVAGARAAAAAPARAAERSRPRAGQVRRAETRSWEQRRGAAALALISYPWRELGWEIYFHPARRGLLGVADATSRRIHVFVRRNQSLPVLAFTVAHEIGHAHDFELGTQRSHDRWRSLRGIDADIPWAGCDGCADLATPAGDFAEVFAVWQVGPVDYRSRMAPLPGRDEMSTLSREFRAPHEVYAQ